MSTMLRLSQGSKTLVMVARFPDEQAAKIATRHDVSVGTDTDVVDGNHNEYKGNVLVHVALTSIPVIPGLGGWNFIKKDSTGIYYSKELLPVGEFFKESEDTTYSFTERVVSEIDENFDLYTEQGNSTPIQLTHDNDGDQLGSVYDLVITNKSPNLSCKSKPLPKRKPSRFVRLSQGSNQMNLLDELAAELGLEITPEMDDAAKLNLIKNAIVELQEKAGESEPAEGEETPPQIPMSQNQPAQQLAQNGGTATTIQQAAAAGNGQNPSQVTVRFSAKDWPQMAVDGVANGRKAILAKHVEAGDITPAQSDEMIRQHCVTSKIRVQMSREHDGKKSANDEFDSSLKVLLAGGSKQWTATGREIADENDPNVQVALSRGQNQSPLLAARARSEQRRKVYQNQ